MLGCPINNPAIYKFLVFWVLSIHLALASSNECRRAFSKLLQQVSIKFTTEGHCCANVFKTLYELQKRGFRVADLRVIFFDYETRLFRPVPVERKIMDGKIALLPAPYLENCQYWNYHFVIIDRHGFVYDSQFKNEPELLRSYLNRVFPQKGVESPQFFPMDRWKHMYIKVIPAKDFVKLYNLKGRDEKKVVNTYKSKTSSLTVREFLEREFPD